MKMNKKDSSPIILIHIFSLKYVHKFTYDLLITDLYHPSWTSICFRITVRIEKEELITKSVTEVISHIFNMLF
jgi:hypothetical protein